MKTRIVLTLVVLLLGLTLVSSGAAASNPPTIEVTGLGWCAPTGAKGAILLYVYDDVNWPSELVFTATSSNPAFVPNSNITIDPNAGNPNHFGLIVEAQPFGPWQKYTTITVTFTDKEDNSASVDVFVRAGNKSANTVFGTNGPDMLFGLDGGDQIFGYKGKDLLCGGPGPDALLGGAGNDALYGNGSDDVLNCGPGEDSGYGGRGNDTNYQNTCENYLE